MWSIRIVFCLGIGGKGRALIGVYGHHASLGFLKVVFFSGKLGTNKVPLCLWGRRTWGKKLMSAFRLAAAKARVWKGYSCHVLFVKCPWRWWLLYKWQVMKYHYGVISNYYLRWLRFGFLIPSPVIYYRIWKYRESGRQQHLQGTITGNLIYLKKRLRLCRNDFGIKEYKQMCSLIQHFSIQSLRSSFPRCKISTFFFSSPRTEWQQQCLFQQERNLRQFWLNGAAAVFRAANCDCTEEMWVYKLAADFLK